MQNTDRWRSDQFQQPIFGIPGQRLTSPGLIYKQGRGFHFIYKQENSVFWVFLSEIHSQKKGL